MSTSKVSFRIATEAELAQHTGRELVHFNSLPSLDPFLPGLAQTPIKLPTGSELLAAAKQSTKKAKFDLLLFAQRNNGKERPHTHLLADLLRVAYSPVSTHCQTVLLREQRPGEPDLRDPNTCLLFFKYYDPNLSEDLCLRYVGSLIVNVREPIFTVLARLRTMAGLPGMSPIELYEDIKMRADGEEFTHTLRRDRLTFQEVGFCTGDIIVLQKMGETPTYSSEAPKLPNYVNPLPKPDPKVVDSGFQPYFHELLETGYMSDVSVKIGDHVFPAHKIVLSRLAYFQERLVAAEQQKQVSPSLMFQLENISRDVFALVLRYVYTGLFEAGTTLPIHDLFQVILAADYLGASQLIDRCFSLLRDRLQSPDLIVAALCLLERLPYKESKSGVGYRVVWVQHLAQRLYELDECDEFLKVPRAHPKLFRDILLATAQVN